MNLNKLLYVRMRLLSMAILLFLSLCFLSIESYSQPPSSPPVSLSKFLSIAGTFEGEMIGSWGGNPFKMKLTHKNTIGSNGWCLYIDEIGEGGDMKFSSQNLFGYDMGEDKIHLYTVSNMGETHDHSGKWVDDNNFILQYSGMKDGKPYTEQITCNVASKDEYSFKGYEYVAGQLTFSAQATMKRKKDVTTK